jgi:hypothetical protein
MPLRDKDLRFDSYCCRDAAGLPFAYVSIRIRAESLRTLGLHPDQPTSSIVGPCPPSWWHAAGDRYALFSRRAASSKDDLH